MFKVASLHARFFLGLLDDEKDAGFLSLDAEAPSGTLTTAGSLRYNFTYSGVTRYPASGTLQQVKSPQVLARIVDASSTDYSFTVEFFHSQDVTNNGTLWVPSSGVSPFVVWTVRNPSSNTNVVEISASTGKTATFTYDNSSSPHKWSLSETGNLQTTVAWEEAAGADVDEFLEIRNGANLVSKTKRRYQTIDGERYLKELVEGASTNTLTTSFTLLTTGITAGLPSRIDYPDGRWEVFEYDNRARVLIRYEAFADLPQPETGEPPTAANGRKTEYSYEQLNPTYDKMFRIGTARTTTGYAPRYSGGSWTWVTNSTRFFWTPDSATTHEAVSIRLGSAIWNDSDNLITKTQVFDVSTNSATFGRPQLIVRPDGTGSVFSYSTNSGNLTLIEKRGQLTNQTGVVNGTETTTVRNSLGRLLSVTVRNIASDVVGPILSQQTLSYSGSTLQEDYTVTDLAGRVTTYLNSSCCGLPESMTDPDGRVTEYEYDDLKRLVATKTTWGSSWVKMTNVLDAAGRVLAVQRIPSSGATQTLEQHAYDVLGRTTKHTNAWGGVTSFTYDVPNRTNTITYPDGGNRIEVTYLDGRTKMVSGSAIASTRYDVGVEPEGSPAVMREVLRTIRLNSAGGTNEWTLDVSDDLGRNLRTYYAKSSGSPYSENLYNNLGQLIQRRDPDGVSELYSYNPDGTRNRTAVDLNGNGQINETDGDNTKPDDRITYTVRDVVASASSGKSPPTDLERIQTFAYLNDDSSTNRLISMVETSTDGRRAWSTVYRDASTPVTTYTEVGTVSSGTRTNKVTNPDQSYSERVYSYGRLTTAREKNSGGTQVSSVSYGYDAYGRVSSQTDARNGATSFTYYDSDTVQTVSAPALGTGEPQQVTVSYYDSMGRVSGQLLPDSTTVTNFYYVTGLLQKTFGSRTYPVEYTYDVQGRMKTMKTWQSFNGGAGTAAVTTWNYDTHRGWLVSKDYPNATTGAASTAGPNYAYTDAGRLFTRTWERGVVSTNEYKVVEGSTNTAGNLRKVSYSDTTPAITYTYDRRGRLATAIRDGATNSYTYNDANQPLTESHSGDTLAGLSLARTYDSSLRLSTLDAKRSGSSFQLVGYTYDTAGRLDLVKSNDQSTVTAKYSYESNSRLIKSVAFTNNASGEGMLTTRAWDRLNRLTSTHSQAFLSSTNFGNPVGYAYQYNPANQRTRADLADGSYWVYQYDRLGQVISGKRYWADGTLMAGQDFDYKFDDIGNRDTTGGRASAVSDYTANQLNQYSSRTVANKLDILGVANPTANVEVWKDSDSPSNANRSGEYFHLALSVANGSYPQVYAKSLSGTNQQATAGRSFVPPSTEEYHYDTDGNLVDDGRWISHVWDGENRLIEMSRDTNALAAARQKVTFAYDHLGRRTRKTYFTHNGTNWVEQRSTKYLHDGWNLVAELDANNSNATLRTYVWGTDLSGSQTGAGGVGGLLWLNNQQTSTNGMPTGIQFVAYDGSGNVAGLFAAADASNSARYEYGPFGEPVRATGPLAGANPVRWSTKVTDDETGLVYYGYRYYSPSTGRWLSRDPIEETGGQHLYSICDDDSINSVDANGLYSHGVGGNNAPPSTAWCRAFSNVGSGDDCSAYRLGCQWASGRSAPTRDFRGDDLIAQEMKATPEVAKARNIVKVKLRSGCRVGDPTDVVRSLQGEPMADFYKGYWQDLLGDNPTRAFMGSFSGTATITQCWGGLGQPGCRRCAVVWFSISNTAGWQSATRFPPILGGYDNGNALIKPLALRINSGPYKSILPDNCFGPFGANVKISISWYEMICR